MRLYNILRHIEANGPLHPEDGLCQNVQYHNRALYSDPIPGGSLILMLDLFREWPEGTGMRDYPVPGVDDHNRQESFWFLSKWATNAKYGQSRWRLLRWMIKELEPS